MLCPASPVKEIVVFFMSMTPLIELRGSIPFGIGCSGNPFVITLISIIGNFLVTIPILLGLPWLEKNIEKLDPRINKWMLELFHKTRKKHSKKINLYGHIALITIVALPIPGTGAWSGCLIAHLFGIPFDKSVKYIGIGVAIAGVIVSLAVVGVVSLF